MSADVHSLVGAYALDALDDLERAQFERHLVSCVDCQIEVEVLLATTARLGAAAAETPPPGLRDAVLAAADVTRQRSPAGWKPNASSWPRWRAAAIPAVAAALAVVVTLAATGVLRRGPDPAAVALADVSAVLAAPDARTVALSGTAEFTASVVEAPSTDRAVVAVNGLAERPDGQVYVLWAFRDGTPVNEQTLTADTVGGAGAVILEGTAGVSQVAVTVEPQGDVVAPTGPVVAQVALQ